VGGYGAVEFLEFGFDNLRDCRDIKVIVSGIVGGGALRLAQRTLDWKLWMRWMLAGLAEQVNVVLRMRL
jgi:hypothetical protein